MVRGFTVGQWLSILLALLQLLWPSAGAPLAGSGSSLAIWLADAGGRPAERAPPQITTRSATPVPESYPTRCRTRPAPHQDLVAASRPRNLPSSPSRLWSLQPSSGASAHGRSRYSPGSAGLGT